MVLSFDEMMELLLPLPLSPVPDDVDDDDDLVLIIKMTTPTQKQPATRPITSGIALLFCPAVMLGQQPPPPRPLRPCLFFDVLAVDDNVDDSLIRSGSISCPLGAMVMVVMMLMLGLGLAY
jgi:hypothetical protein